MRDGRGWRATSFYSSAAEFNLNIKLIHTQLSS